MKKAIQVKLMALALIVAPWVSQAQSRTYTETDFSGVSLAISGTITVQQGDSYSIVLEGDDDDLDKIEVKVEEGILIIGAGNDSWRRMGQITGTVTLPTIEKLAVGGSGTLQTDGQINAGDIKLAVAGSGELHADVSANNVQASIAGSGDLKISGTCNDLDVAVSGSGELYAEGLAAGDCEVALSGSGEAHVKASGDLKARISGSGDVYYYGDPASVDARVSGSGDVRKRN